MLRALLAAVILSLVATPVWAKGPKHKEEPASQPALTESAPATLPPVFSKEERRILEQILGMGGTSRQPPQEQGAGKKLPPGLAKKVARGGALPPGWQKKLQRGEVMDREVYGQATPISQELLKRLPISPAGTRLLQLEDRVVRVMDATRAIVDVLELPR